jgi:hypothetical protein
LNVITGVLVMAGDNYQGEKNDVIILSLKIPTLDLDLKSR